MSDRCTQSRRCGQQNDPVLPSHWGQAPFLSWLKATDRGHVVTHTVQQAWEERGDAGQAGAGERTQRNGSKGERSRDVAGLIGCVVECNGRLAWEVYQL